MEPILEWGIPWILALQNLGDWLTGLMKVFTVMGNEEFYLIVAPILFWFVDTSIGLRMGLVLMLSGGLNSILKLSLAYPRPYWVDPKVIAFTTESSFGAPSGHAQNAMAAWGTLAASQKKAWAWAAAGIVIFLIGISRLYLGVHFPLDTLVGWIVGAFLLIILLRIEPCLIRSLKRYAPYQQTLLVLSVSLSLIAVGALIRHLQGAWEFPASWLKTIAITAPEAELPTPMALSGLISNMGAFFGLAAGYIGLRLRGSYQPRGTRQQILIRYVLGLIGVLLIWKGLDLILPGDETLIGYTCRFLRYSLVGLWVTGLAPFMFIRLKLASAQFGN
jgi:membrane-associated phospholipid phosphatase